MDNNAANSAANTPIIVVSIALNSAANNPPIKSLFAGVTAAPYSSLSSSTIIPIIFGTDVNNASVKTQEKQKTKNPKVHKQKPFIIELNMEKMVKILTKNHTNNIINYKTQTMAVVLVIVQE